MQFVFLLEQVVNGLVLAGYYLLIALGLSFIFSVGGVVNLAHGAFYALGAYASVEANQLSRLWHGGRHFTAGGRTVRDSCSSASCCDDSIRPTPF